MINGFSEQGQSDYKVSCHEDEKPICCDTQCKCDLNLLKFQIKGKCKKYIVFFPALYSYYY